ncbi:hypothetical protein E2562_029608 [Oryza meyeriana var. granulata]|uniref:Uncharacterized protein n=1 Tax=Oryza meyeriana var. granulata TaxID=110450 RepID=A0A6G1E438_9ORYZ|nr:hypothetical protein E2562_029608 [Oryza meyeriana var. granulata]
MQSHADAGSPAATAPSSPTSRLTRSGDDDDDGVGGVGSGHFFFFSAPASPFAARQHGAGDGATAMSSAEELFVAGRIRVGCLSPIRQEATVGLAAAEPASRQDHRAFGLLRVSNTRRRISLRDLLLGGTANNNDSATAAGPSIAERSSGFWPPSIWPSSRSKKTATLALPCPCPAPLQPARRSTSSDRSSAPRRRTTSLPYRQGLVLGCLGFGARSYGLAKSMHPLSSRAT